MYEHRVSRPDGVRVVAQIVGSHTLQYGRCRRHEVDAYGNRYQFPGRDNRIVGIGAGRHCIGHDVTDGGRFNVRPQCVHDASAFAAGSEWQVSPVLPAALVDIDEVYAYRLEHDPHFAPAGFGHILFLQAHDFRTTVFMNADYSQGNSLLGDFIKSTHGQIQPVILSIVYFSEDLLPFQ